MNVMQIDAKKLADLQAQVTKMQNLSPLAAGYVLGVAETLGLVVSHLAPGPAVRLIQCVHIGHASG